MRNLSMFGHWRCLLTLRQAHKWIVPIRNEMDSRFYYFYFPKIYIFFLSNQLDLSN